MKVSCLIIDDEPLAVGLLQQYAEQVPYLEIKGKCYSAVEALSFLHQQQVDLLFLDINMPKLTGMELANILSSSQKIIFTTAYSEYAVESYERNAVDYLLKPITFERFIKAVNKAFLSFKQEEEEVVPEIMKISGDSLFVKTGKAIVQLSYEGVRFIEGLKDYVAFHTTEGKHIVHKRMKELETILPSNFIRIHNSYIVNIRKIRRVEDHVISIDKDQLPVSEKYREGFYHAVERNSL